MGILDVPGLSQAAGDARYAKQQTTPTTTGASGTPTANVVGTGTLTTFPILAIPLPANALKANGTWVVTFEIGCTNSASAKNVTAAFNAQDCGLVLSLVSVASNIVTLTIRAKSSSAQTVKNSIAPTASSTALTADLTQANTLTILGTLTTTGDIMNVQSWSAVASNV